MRTEDDLRAALTALERHAPRADRVLPVVVARGSRWLIRLSAVGTAAAVAGAVAVLTLPGATRPGTPRTGGAPVGGAQTKTHIPNGPLVPAHAQLTARKVLLRAAAGAAAASGAGRYWRVEVISGRLDATGPNKHPYAVSQRFTPQFSWDARSPGQRSWTLPSTGSATTLFSPGAAAVWRADGSPPLPKYSSPRQGWWQTGGAVGYFGNANLTFRQFQALPLDPAQLAAVMRREVRSERFPAGKATDERMFDISTQLLKLDPVTPAVRAAVFRVLATIPGVSLTGPVTDPLGRTGYGITLNEGSRGEPPGTVDETLVIDPGTGAVLADESVAANLPAGFKVPASGALPGHAPKCLSVKPTASKRVFICVTKHGSSAYIKQGRGFQPQLVVPPGTAVSYDAVVAAGWTSAAPKLPPADEQFSVATQGRG